MRADGQVHVPLDEDDVRAAGRKLRPLRVDCIAVCFLHSHAWPDHERRAAGILREIVGERTLVIASSDVHPEFREYERFSTTVLNAALLTVMHAYLDRLEKSVAGLGIPCSPTVSQSAGGLLSIGAARRAPIRTALSGPAAGAIGAAFRAKQAGFPEIITLDVGGTSADVALLAKGEPALVHSRMLAGFPLRLPALDVNSVGAGGGSIAWIDRDGLLKVGPQSAGAVPGPACYGRGGTQATVTDAQVLLGRLDAASLLDGRMTIRRDLAEAAVGRLAEKLGLPLIETALGIVRLVCATIVKATRSLSVERGHDPAAFALFVFGGAGPLHATETARELGMRRIVVPPHPGILCAEGLLNSDLATDFVQAAHVAGGRGRRPGARGGAGGAAPPRRGPGSRASGSPEAGRRTAWTADLRYVGQNFELGIGVDPEPIGPEACRELMERFHAEHDRSYGFAQRQEPIEMVSLRVKLAGILDKPGLGRADGAAGGLPYGRRRVVLPWTSGGRRRSTAAPSWRPARRSPARRYSSRWTARLRCFRAIRRGSIAGAISSSNSD